MIKSRVFVCAALTALAMAMLGCSSHPGIVDYEGYRTDVAFAERIVPQKSTDLSEHASPEELVAHALALGKEGRWGDSGDLFTELAEIKSRDGSWESRCNAAAALCYLHAGRLDACAGAASATGEPAGWSRYGQPDEVQAVREIGDLIGRALTPDQLDSELVEIANPRR